MKQYISPLSRVHMMIAIIIHNLLTGGRQPKQINQLRHTMVHLNRMKRIYTITVVWEELRIIVAVSRKYQHLPAEINRQVLILIKEHLLRFTTLLVEKVVLILEVTVEPKILKQALLERLEAALQSGNNCSNHQHSNSTTWTSDQEEPVMVGVTITILYHN